MLHVLDKISIFEIYFKAKLKFTIDMNEEKDLV